MRPAARGGLPGVAQVGVGQRVGQRRRAGAGRARDVLHRAAGAEQIRRRAPVGDLEMARRDSAATRAPRDAARGCDRKYSARRAPPASTAWSSWRKSRVPATIITGWLFRTKSCAVSPGVRFSPSADVRDLDRHPAHVFLAIRLATPRWQSGCRRGYVRGRAKRPTLQLGRQACRHGELGVDAAGGPSLIEAAARCRSDGASRSLP